jgi:hypothetical protein
LKALTSMSGNGTSAKSRVKGSLDVEDDDEVGRSLLLGLVLIVDVEACCWCWSSRAWWTSWTRCRATLWFWGTASVPWNIGTLTGVWTSVAEGERVDWELLLRWWWKMREWCRCGGEMSVILGQLAIGIGKK